MGSFFTRMNPTARGFLIIAVIAAIIVALQLQMTLVADGALDRLDTAANSRRLAALVPGALLVFYRGAGHAFLSQDEASFAARVEAFLG